MTETIDYTPSESAMYRVGWDYVRGIMKCIGETYDPPDDGDWNWGERYLAFYDDIEVDDSQAWEWTDGAAKYGEGIPLTPEFREWVLRWMRCGVYHSAHEDGIPDIDYMHLDMEEAYMNRQHAPRRFDERTAASWDAPPKVDRAPLCEYCHACMHDCRCGA